MNGQSSKPQQIKKSKLMRPFFSLEKGNNSMENQGKESNNSVEKTRSQWKSKNQLKNPKSYGST